MKTHKVEEKTEEECTLSPLLSAIFLTSSIMLIPLVSMLPTAINQIISW